MSEYAVITQNDESKWDDIDIKGDLYHYPSTYQSILTPGCRIIYYKGKMRNRAFASQRLAPEPHYFGIGVVGDSIVDPDSERKDRYRRRQRLPALRFDGSVQLEGDLGRTLSEATIVSLSQYSTISSSNDYLYTIGDSGVSGSQMTLPRRSGELVYDFDDALQNSPSGTCIPARTFLPKTHGPHRLSKAAPGSLRTGPRTHD